MPQSIYLEAARFLPFAAATAFTPGPNNLMLATSGARFGFVRSLPLACGVVVGFAAMNLLVGTGFAGLLAAAPALFRVLQIVAVAYFVYLAWRTATAGAPKPGKATPRPLGFLQATALQAVNPKAWIMSMGAVTAYSAPGPEFVRQLLVILATFAAVGVASSSTWAMFGQVIRGYLTTPRRRLTFNLSMAALLLASIAPLLADRL